MTENNSTPAHSAALLVLDMQPGFLKAVPGQQKLLSRTRFAVEAATLLDIRVFFTEQSPEKLGSTHPDLMEAAALESGGADRENRIFPKTCFSALDSKALASRLADDQIEHLLLAGIEAPICVYQTALSALENDFQITLLSDCIGGRRSEDLPPVFELLRTHGCYPLPSECVFYSILKTADHDAFRAMTALVKKYSHPA